jgi:acetyl-CoA C-acetyltransferase
MAPESTPSPRVAIVGAARTPIGKFGRKLRLTPAVTLGVVASRAALERASILPTDIPEVIAGHAIQAGTGQNPARQLLEGLQIPHSAGATTINMVCGSSLKALHLGTSELRSGEFDLALIAGMESMDSAPYLVPAEARWGGFKHGDRVLQDSMNRDALTDAYGEHENMGQTGERIARKLHLTRGELDAYAIRSHQRAARATTAGIWAQEIAPVAPELTATGEGLSADEGPRGDSTPESLARLPSAFGEGGLLTAGNSSQLSDGGAAVVLATEAAVDRRGLRPLAWVHSAGVGGVDPADVMEAPIPTVEAHLKRVGLRAEEIDRIEHNEAYSSASIAVQRHFHFADDRFNVNGGAIALGHPIGASGIRIVVTLLHEMQRSRSNLGLATLCMGGGNGLSVVLDRRGL